MKDAPGVNPGGSQSASSANVLPQLVGSQDSTKWSYNQHTQSVVHNTTNCAPCQEYSKHVAMALAFNDPSWTTANHEREASFRQKLAAPPVTAETLELTRKVGELSGTIITLQKNNDSLKTDNSRLYNDKNYYKDQTERFQEQIDGLEQELQDRENRIKELTTELEELRVAPPVGDRAPKKRRLDGTTSYSTSEYSHPESSIDFIMEAPTTSYIPLPRPVIPGGGHLSQVDGVVRTGTDAESARRNEAIGLPPPRASLTRPPKQPPTEPVMVSQADEYFRILRTSEEPGKNRAWPVYKMLTRMKERIEGLPTEQRSEVENHIIQHYYIPQFVVDANEAKKHGRPQRNLETPEQKEARQEAHQANQA